jgi:hypothetical protein
MQFFRISLAVLLVICLQSCVPFFHPLAAPANTVFDRALLGRWVQEDEAYVITQGSGEDYEISWSEQGRRYAASALLFELGGQRFLDVIITSIKPRAESDGILMPVHLPLKVRLEADRVLVQQMDSAAVENLLASGQLGWKHERRKDEILVTARTGDIATVLTNQTLAGRLWEEAVEFRRAQ